MNLRKQLSMPVLFVVGTLRQEPEISLKRIAASALSDIAKHSPELAQAEGCSAVTYLAVLIGHSDTKLKRQVCMGLAQIATVLTLPKSLSKQDFPKYWSALKIQTATFKERIYMHS